MKRIMFFGCVLFCLQGCVPLIVPYHVAGIDPNLRIVSATPKIGSRVAPGTRVSLTVKYQIEVFQADERYFMIVCSYLTCEGSPPVVQEIKTQKGRMTLSFVYSAEDMTSVLIVRGKPRLELEECEERFIAPPCMRSSRNQLASADFSFSRPL